MRIAILGLIALGACSGRGPKALGGHPSWQKQGASGPVEQKPVTFAPSTEAAQEYNQGATPPPASELGDAVIAAVTAAAKSAGLGTPVADGRLFRACQQLAEIVPEEGIIAYSLVEFALHHNGIVEPSPHLLVVWGDIQSPQVIVEQLQPRLAEILADGASARVGIGAAVRDKDGTGAVVFALQASAVSTRPIPRALPAGGSFTLDAVVDSRYRSPEVFITRDTGSTERLELQLGASGAFRATVACKHHTGRQQVEITASDVQGSTVLANFPVYCGTTPPASLTVTPSIDDSPVSDPLEAEQRLLTLVNRDRAAHGLSPLAWDEQVAEVGRGHSREMRDTKVVAHISPTTGSAADRVKAAGIKTPVVLENVARAYGLGEAHLGLMNSPGHRANILSASATHLGIGVIYGAEISGRKEIFVTQVFTRVPPKLDPPAAIATLRSKIAGVAPGVEDAPKLQAIAQTMANQLAAGKTREQAYPQVKRDVDKLGNIYARVGSIITAAGDVDSLDGESIVGDVKPHAVGIGVAQGPHPELGDHAIWIVILLATKR